MRSSMDDDSVLLIQHVARMLQDHGSPAPAAMVAGWLADCAVQAQQQPRKGPPH